MALRAVGDDADGVGLLVELGADGAVVAGRGELAADHEEDAVGEGLDLFEDVGRDEDCLALGGKLAHEVVELDALAGVGAVQRLIEDEHIGLVHHCGGESHALPHSTGVAAELSALRLGHSGALDGKVGGLGYVGHAVELCGELNELAAGVEAVDGLMLGHDTDATVEVGIAARRLAEDGDRSVGRVGQALDHLEERGLARAVRPQEARDARFYLERNVVHGNDAAIPLGDVFHRDDGGRCAGHIVILR